MLNDLDNYVNYILNGVSVPEEFQPKINVVYPPNNFIEFERWFCMNYQGDVDVNKTRIYLPIFWTAYYVNNNYGQDKEAINRLQIFIDGLDKTKKYFTIIQYDDGILNDISELDLYQFNMSKPYDYTLPLIGQPHPYKFNFSEKKYIANFVGSITHPIRKHAMSLSNKEGYYISTNYHDPYNYCRVLAESVFTLCYRGYGLNSFRIAEALQYGSIPIYISDAWLKPHNIPFNYYGIKTSDLNGLEDNISSWYQHNNMYAARIGSEYYKEYFTYEGTKDKIIKHLQTLK